MQASPCLQKPSSKLGLWLGKRVLENRQELATLVHQDVDVIAGASSSRIVVRSFQRVTAVFDGELSKHQLIVRTRICTNCSN